MVKIAFSGKCGSGKSTAAQLVCNKQPQTVKYSFAAKIKELATELFGMTEKDRPLLLDFGGKMRQIDPNVWLNYVINQSKNKEHVVIDDLRFPNEYNALKAEGFILVRLNITLETQIKRLTKLYPNTWKEHVEKLGVDAEIALDNHDFDYYINTEDFGDIENFIKLLISE